MDPSNGGSTAIDSVNGAVEVQCDYILDFLATFITRKGGFTEIWLGPRITSKYETTTKHFFVMTGYSTSLAMLHLTHRDLHGRTHITDKSCN